MHNLVSNHNKPRAYWMKKLQSNSQGNERKSTYENSAKALIIMRSTAAKDLMSSAIYELHVCAEK